MAELSEYLAARMNVRLAESRELAEQPALEAVLEQRPLWTRWQLEPLQARSPEQAWRAEVRRRRGASRRRCAGGRFGKAAGGPRGVAGSHFRRRFAGGCGG
jgi:hypothetical protein